MAAVAIGAYFIFHVLTPWAYEFGPVLLLLLTFLSLGFQWKQVGQLVDGESLCFLGALGFYFISQVLILIVHGEDISEFDLSFRYLAAGLVLLFLLVNPISAAQIFLFVGVGGLFTGAYSIYLAAFQDAGRVQSFDNPIHFGNGALALSCLCLAGLAWAVSERRGVLWTGLLGVGFAGGLIASLLSGTRSSWVAFPVLVLLVFLAYRDRLLSKKWLLPSFFVAVVLLPVSLASVDLVEQRIQAAAKEFTAYFEEGVNYSSVGTRLDMYKAGLTAFRKNPLIGVGPAGTDAVVGELVQAGEIHSNVGLFRHLHNQYIDNMARYGLVGLVAYLALLIVPFVLFMKKTRSGTPSVKSLGLGGALFVSLHGVANLTQSLLERNVGVMMFVFAMVFIWAVLKREERLANGATAPVMSKA
ncbi:O-antigen ligase family protein [Marinobacter lacisalsi]|uniref:O-antigen ligase family protein n=1 Tax=Marinobacter lacisalsi TaxID=475979 RepID=A0ABV8QFQ1_9GAMM